MTEDIHEFLMNIEPVSIDNGKIDLTAYTKFPFAQISSLGAAFSSLITPFRTITQSFSINMPFPIYAAMHNGSPVKLLYQRHDGAGLSSGLYDYATKSTFNAAFDQINQLPVTANTVMPYNPAVLFMAATLISIDKKLNVIQETQQNILEFIQDDKRAKIKGNLAFLCDTLSNYKYNWSNETFKQNMHVKVLDIKQESEQNITFYQEQIRKRLDARNRLITDKQIKDTMKKMQTDIEYLRFSVYSFAYTSFLEMVLLENFDSDYIKSILSQISKHSYHYRKTYTQCYNWFEDKEKSSVNTKVIGGLSAFSNGTGNTINKIPVIGDSKFDKSLVAFSKHLKNLKQTKLDDVIDNFRQSKDPYVQVFTECINTLDELHNKPVEILFDNDNLYLKPVEPVAKS